MRKLLLILDVSSSVNLYGGSTEGTQKWLPQANIGLFGAL